MLFYYLKTIHIISSAVLFATGIGTALYMLLANLEKDIHHIHKVAKQVVRADWIFTGTSAVVQPITGFWIVYLQGYSLTAFWIWGSVLGYIIAGACWLPVVYIQIRCRDLAKSLSEYDGQETPWHQTALAKKYYRYYFSWVILGIPAFVSLVGVFYLMTNRPGM